ncbi:hypothetical protein [Mesorhizobium sp. LSHC412B00]|uniref:glutamine amidotransferase-related protein n=1 Tax=Mesorhizobium sp. LSHC412B00 TaxID=1287285 RepID=UPI0018DCA038
MLLEEGFDLDIRRPPLGDSLPETLEGHAGAVVFGGPMSANDEDEFVRRETNWLNVPLKENRPFLGICLGAQMLANHLGGKVEGHGEGLVRDRLVSAEADRSRQKAAALARHGLPVSPRRLFAAQGCDAAGDGGNLPQPGFSLWRQCLGHPVPWRTDPVDDAALGGARRTPLRIARRAAWPRPSRRPADLGYAPQALAERVFEPDLRQAY